MACLAESAYSSVHTELAAMKNEGLVTSRFEGRAELFSKNDDYLFKSALLALLDAPAVSVQNQPIHENDLLANLAKYGAPIANSSPAHSTLSLEETLVHGLALARRDSTVARSLPACFGS